MDKFCACGREMCPICKGTRSVTPPTRSVTRKGSKETPRYTFGGKAKRGVTEEVVPAPEPTRAVTADIREGSPSKVPCACGCGQMVKVRPVYFSAACRVRAKRVRDNEKAHEAT